MGQPVTVVEKPSAIGGIVRFEINRAITGMGHERYSPGDDIIGARPPDELARRLFERGGVDAVHVNSNIITLDMAKGSDTKGIRALIEGLFTYYREGVEVEIPT